VADSSGLLSHAPTLSSWLFLIYLKRLNLKPSVLNLFKSFNHQSVELLIKTKNTPFMMLV
jgi:hypothetical protein